MPTSDHLTKPLEPGYMERVLRARAQDPCEKLLDGFRMFESALAFTEAGVAAELETDDPQAIHEGVLKRFERVRKVQEAGLYKPVLTPVNHDD